MTEALIGLGLMMVLALLRLPIAFAMGLVGFLGVAYLRDWNFAPAMAMVETKVYETGRNYTLSVVPLFILHRPPARRPGHGDGGRLRRLRRHLRVLDRNRGDDGQGRLSGHARARLLGPLVYGRHRWRSGRRRCIRCRR